MKLPNNESLESLQKKIAANTAKGKAKLRGEVPPRVIAERMAVCLSAPNATESENHQPFIAVNFMPPFHYSRLRTFSVKADPMGAPRMTRRDKWLKPARSCVQRYWDYRDAIRAVVGDVPIVPDGIVIRAFVSMPESWSKKKQSEMAGKPHRNRPDGDNITKGIKDAIFAEDGGVWMEYAEKRWCARGEERMEITFLFV